ncbi:MAG: sulfatase, partial [Halobacteriaceae archaeon]
GFYGYDRDTSPTLDDLAKNSLTFTNAIAPAVPTAPSMFATFTGRHTTSNALNFDVEDWQRRFRKRTTLAQVLRQSGFSTKAIHRNAYASSWYGFDKGFDTFEDDDAASSVETQQQGGSKLAETIEGIKKTVFKTGTATPWTEYYEQIQQWIKSTEEPYFLWILLLDTHTPYYPQRKIWSGSELRLAYKYWDLERNNWKSDKTHQDVLNAYDDCVRDVDDFIAQLVQDIDIEKTNIIFHGDHGEAFGEQGYYRHPPELDEELIHVPLLMYGPDFPSKTISKPTSLTTIAPTIFKNEGIQKRWPAPHYSDNNTPPIVKLFRNDRRALAVRTSRKKYRREREDETIENLQDNEYRLDTEELESYTTRELRSIAEENIHNEILNRRQRYYDLHE